MFSATPKKSVMRKIATGTYSKPSIEQGMGDHDSLLSPRSVAKQCAEVQSLEEAFTKYLVSKGVP